MSWSTLFTQPSWTPRVMRRLPGEHRSRTRRLRRRIRPCQPPVSASSRLKKDLSPTSAEALPAFTRLNSHFLKVLLFLTPPCCLTLSPVRYVDAGLRPTVRLLPHTHTVLHARSGMSDSLRPRGLQPASLPCPRGSPGKNTGVGGHFLLQGVFSTQGLNPCLLCLLHCRQFFTTWAIKTKFSVSLVHITFYSPTELFFFCLHQCFKPWQDTDMNLLKHWDAKIFSSPTVGFGLFLPSS